MRRRLPLFAGREFIDTYREPILGDPGAEYVVVELFDYSCRHCRDLHGYLEEARQRYGDQLAIVVLPMPMNTDCNGYIQSTHEDHVDACHYARLALAVWELAPTEFEGYHHWLLEPARPPSVEAATEYAVERLKRAAIDREALEQMRDGRNVEKRLERYTWYFRRAGGGGIPKLLAGTSAVTLQPSGREKVFEILEQILPIKPVSSSSQ
jgi:hypothetical protein